MRKWNKKEVIKELRLRARELRHSPSVSEVPSYLYGASYHKFGSFNKAKLATNLSINKVKYNPIKNSAYNVSKEFAYILGVVYGDGHCKLYKNKHGTSGVISLAVRDQDFALNFKRILENWSGLKAKYRLNKRMFHEVTLNSVDACRIIKNFDLDSMLGWKKESQSEFLKGLFDSDGGIIGKNLDKRKYAKRWLHFSNNNKILIELVRSILDKLQIKYSLTKRIHSGFGSKKWQYEIKIYNLKGMFK